MAAPGASLSSVEKLASVGPASSQPERLRLLVVDDDDAVRNMLTQFFKDEGFETTNAENGMHALSVASAVQPDVIVLDMGLPILDATGFAQQWKKRAEAVDLPIIAISGLPFGEAMSREIGVAAFYDKPLDLHRLSRTAHELALRRRQNRRRPEHA